VAGIGRWRKGEIKENKELGEGRGDGWGRGRLGKHSVLS
jgi:hypothetical protein